MLTLGQLREAISLIDKRHDHAEVQCWLPGSYITLGKPFVSQKGIILEGNIKPGSALSS